MRAACSMLIARAPPCKSPKKLVKRGRTVKPYNPISPFSLFFSPCDSSSVSLFSVLRPGGLISFVVFVSCFILGVRIYKEN